MQSPFTPRNVNDNIAFICDLICVNKNLCLEKHLR